MGTSAHSRPVESYVRISQLRELADLMSKSELKGIPVAFWQAFAEAVDEPEHPVVKAVTSRPTVSRPLVLVTGGLDSTIAYLRLEKDKRNPVGLYVDFGQPYREAEIAVLRELHIGYAEHRILLGPRDDAWRHIIPGRNMLALLSASEIAQPGTPIYFSVVHGENPKTGGDKSNRFVRLMRELLPNPIQTMTAYTKSEWVGLALREGIDPQVLLHTYSCFEGEVGWQCGRCQACLRRFIAFANNDLSKEALWNYRVHPLEGCIDAIQKIGRAHV